MITKNKSPVVAELGFNPKSPRTDMKTNTTGSKKQAITSYELLKQLAARSDLHASELRVYTFIAACCGLSPNSGKWCWYSHKQIGEAVGAHRVNVTSAIGILLFKKMLAEDTSETQRAKNAQVKSYCLTPPENWAPIDIARGKKGRSRVAHTLQVEARSDDAPVIHTLQVPPPTCNTHATGTCSTHATGPLTLNRKENKKIKLKKREIPPDADFTPPEVTPDELADLWAQAPLYEPDGSHDTDSVFNHIDNSYDNTHDEDNTNDCTNSNSYATNNDTSINNNIDSNMEVSMDDDTSATENHANSPVGDSSITCLAVISPAPETRLTANDRREIALCEHGESALRKARGSKYRYFPQHMKLARDWAEYGTYEMPSLRVNLEAWANEIRLIEENDHFGVDLLRAMLEFVIKDQFWRPNALSVMGLRKASKNGMRKLENISNAMRNSRAYKEKMVRETFSQDDFSVKQQHRFSFEPTIDEDEIPF